MDFLMIENGDGGEVDVLSDGDIVIDRTYYTSIYLTLFGGKCFYKQFDMDFPDDNESIEKELNKPTTQDNLKNLANMINFKLNWMVELGLAESIDTEALDGINSITKVNIAIVQPDGNTERYGIIWDREKSELKRYGEIYGRI